MAEETKKILSIKVEGEKSVKSLKDEIKSLRDALLNTEKGSDEYKKIVDKLVESQTKLNDVMSAGKSTSDGAAGSYNALVQEMSALKTVWKQVNDEGERDRLGARIKEINDQLKEMDASIGNHQRNVGNYSGSWKQASTLISREIGKINPALGEIAKSVTGMIPKINATTTAAKVGLTGVKAAIVSTGIGALIVALGIALGEVTKLFNRWIEKAKEMTPANRAAAESTRLLKEEYDKLTGTMTEVIRQFEEYYEIQDIYADTNEAKIALLNQRYEQANENFAQATVEYENAISKVEEYEQAHKKMSKQQEAEYEQLKKNTDAIKENMDYWDKQANNAAKNIRLTIARMDKARKDAEKANKGLADSVSNSTEQMVEEYTSIFDIQDELIKKWSENADWEEKNFLKMKYFRNGISKEYEYLENDLINFLSELTSAERKFTQSNQKIDIENRALIDVISKRYKSAQDDIEVLYKNGEISYEKYLDLLEELHKRYISAYNVIDTQWRNKEKQNRIDYEEKMSSLTEYYYDKELNTYVKAEKARQDIAENGRREEEYDFVSSEEKKAATELEFAKKRYNNAVEFYNNLKKLYGDNANNVTEVADARKAVEETGRILDEASQKYEANIYKRTTAVNRGIESNLNQLIQSNDYQLTTLETSGQRYTKKYEETLKTRLELFKSYAENMYQYEGESDEAFMERKIAVAEAIANLNVEIYGINTATEIALSQSEERFVVWADNIRYSIGLVGDGIGNIINGWNQLLNAQKAAGEISQEEYDRQFENMKALQIAQVVISTISGSVSAVSESIKSFGVPVGPIVGAALAASLAASGAMQIAAIKKTKPGSSSLGSAGNYGSAKAQPTITEYTPERVSNQTGLNEVTMLSNALKDSPIQAYVVESSVTAKQELAKQRKEETTF